MPDVFLAVGAEDGAVGGDEVRGVVESGAVFFDDGSGDEADGELTREGLVGG